MDNDNELPSFIHYGGITGLVMLALGLILFIVFFVLYGDAYDNNVNLNRQTFPAGYIPMLASYISIGTIGFFLCLLIPYGHYLKSFNDPSVISSTNGLHFETTDPDKGKIKAVEVIPHSDYRGAGSLGSKIIPNSVKLDFKDKKGVIPDTDFL